MRPLPGMVFGALSLCLAGSLLAGEIHGKVLCKGARDGADAIVYVDAIPGKAFPAPAAHPVMDQKNLVFVPHVLPILVGTTVDFRNSDAVLHNVFTPDKCADKFNLGSWPQGQIRSYTFKQPCVAPMLCNVHPEMEAYIVALPTPYFAVTDKTGAYAIKDLPDGAYTLRVWHPKLKETTRSITVSGATAADFEISK